MDAETMENRMETNGSDCVWVQPAVRDLISRRRWLRDRGADELATILGAPEAEVEAALEAITVEGEVLA
jgi:hypothetical protein